MDDNAVYYKINTYDLSFGHTKTYNPSNFMHDIHIHDFYEIYYFLSGDVTYYIEGQTYRLGSNDLLIINNKELHRPYFNSDKPYERIVMHFNPKFFSGFTTQNYNLFNCFENKKLGVNNMLTADEVISCGFTDYIKEIEEALKRNTKEKDIMFLTLFLQALVSLNRAFSIKSSSIAEEHLQKDKKITTILDYINSNLSSKITLALLQEKFFVNKYYLCHIFKSTTGFTIQEYIIYKRIMKAKELLSSGFPVLEVSNEVGFNDYSNFYRTFKRITGNSPKYFSK
jgi:YesN/AraC family two-component response regulator